MLGSGDDLDGCVGGTRRDGSGFEKELGVEFAGETERRLGKRQEPGAEELLGARTAETQ